MSDSMLKKDISVRWGYLLAVVLCALPIVTTARDWPVAVGEGSISRWSGDRIAAFTVTIDDNHAQDHAFWKGLGEEYGLTWTWCIITGNVGSDGSTWAGWQELVDLGHGIASHGLHAYDENTSGINVTNEYRDSQIALTNNLVGVDALTLAYPNGLKPPNDKILAAEYYIAARGVVGGVNTGGSIDYMDPKSISMNPTTAPGITDPGTWYYYGHTINPLHQYYEGWQSVHFHSVLASMETGVTNLAAELIANESDIWTGLFQDVAQYGQERENATLSVTSVTGSEIRFTLTDTLDNALFYYPLTVKVRVDSAWGTVTASQDGSSIPVELVTNGGNTYALVQVVPDQGEVTLQKTLAEVPGLFFVLSTVPRNQIWVDGNFSGAVSSGSYYAPYKTVQAGLDAAAPGMKVTVREGTYREQITLPSGTADKPLTLSAASGERVVLNAMVPLGGWQAETGGLYSTTAGWAPAALYSGFSKMALAREPNEGWWAADSISENVSSNTVTITDTGNLVGLSQDLTGASVYIWTQGADRFYTCPIVSFDSVAGSVEFEKVNSSMVPAAGDKYWLENQLSLIDQPGEWASIPEGGSFRIHFLPEDFSVLAKTQAPPASGRVITGQNVAHVRLNDLEVAGGNDRGIYLLDAQDIEINRCLVHDNMLYGIWMRQATNCTIRNTVSMNNRFGAVCEESANILIEENEIGNNNEDGLVFSRGSSAAVVRRNHIHNHLLWGHPDNSQTYLGVTDIQYIENLIVAGGQSVMLEQTTDAEFTGNMVMGSGANMLNFGHGTVTNVTIHGNTLACSGYSSLGLTGETAYDVKDNIFMAGHSSQMYTVTDAMDYQGDYNLFWNGAGLVDPTLLVSDGAWGGGPPESFTISWDNNDIDGSDGSAPVDVTVAGVSASDLTLSTLAHYTAPVNAFAGRIHDSSTVLATEIANNRYFSVTLTPDAGKSIDFDSVGFEGTLWDWTGTTGSNQVQVALLSSLTGWNTANVLNTVALPENMVNGTHFYDQSFDVSGIAALNTVTEAVEFRFYIINGSDAATAISFGHNNHSGANNGIQDLEFNGTITSDSGGGTPETIYHTSLSTFQAATGQDLNSTNSDPLFVNAPFGINVLDAALLDLATRDTFSLRDANGFLVGDHVEVNFDGVVRTVTASSGAVLTINPPLTEKPLKSYLITNWGTNTNFALDLELQSGSPGIGLGQGGGTVGSPVSVPQYQAGDFDGDGQRDIPEIPNDLDG